MTVIHTEPSSTLIYLIEDWCLVKLLVWHVVYGSLTHFLTFTFITLVGKHANLCMLNMINSLLEHQKLCIDMHCVGFDVESVSDSCIWIWLQTWKVQVWICMVGDRTAGMLGLFLWMFATTDLSFSLHITPTGWQSRPHEFIDESTFRLYCTFTKWEACGSYFHSLSVLFA